MNDGFVPILEIPDKLTNGRGNRVVFESRIIMDYLEDAYPDKGAKLWMSNPEERACQ
jgi:glutathione S-transferase